MNKNVKVIKVLNEVSDFELIRIIKEYEEQGCSVKIDSKNIANGYVELIIKTH